MSNKQNENFVAEIVPLEKNFVVDIKNQKLLEKTLYINELMTQTKKSLYAIACTLFEIKHFGLAEQDGFKDVFEYAEKCFGYKKNMVYQMVQVADNFLIALKSNGNYRSIFYNEDTKEDFTVSQLQEMNRVKDTAKTLVENNVVNYNMTTKEIRDVVKKYKNGEIDDHGNEIKTDDIIDDIDLNEGDFTEPIEKTNEPIENNEDYGFDLLCHQTISNLNDLSQMDEFKEITEVLKQTANLIECIWKEKK